MVRTPGRLVRRYPPAFHREDVASSFDRLVPGGGTAARGQPAVVWQMDEQEALDRREPMTG